MAESIGYKEGQTIQFKIKKHIELSENETYYVLEDFSGRKQLMKSEFYVNYNFKIGQDLNCRVDHINCSGKIFLEPEHPVYEEGEKYEFIIDKIKVSENRLDDETIHFSFKDDIGNPAICISENVNSGDYIVGQKIQCKVERIIKGKLNLSFVKSNSLNLQRDTYYKFRIDDIRTLKDNVKYYILSDDYNQKHLLDCEYYKHHDLKIGQKIECVVIKFSPKGYYILEPKHPFYKAGETYKFEFLKEDKDSKGDITGNYDISVKDVFGEIVKFMSEKSLLINGLKQKHIYCKVSGVKKGKPLLLLT